MLTAFLDRYAAATPAAPALVSDDRRTSWMELRDRVDRLAATIGRDRVFVLDRNHPATVELVLACARGGGTCVIGNWRLAPPEIAWVIRDSAARVLVVGPELAELVRGIRDQIPQVQRVIEIGPELEELVQSSEPVTLVAPDADDSCLQLYTSGTTGFPKGAVLTHRSLGAHTETMLKEFGFHAGSVNLVPMPLFHVGGIAWALLGLSTGGVTVIARDPSPPALLRDIERHRVTHTFVVPAILQGLLMQPDFASRDLSSLDTVLYGASPIPLPLLERCLAAFPCKLNQVYGMTEMSGVVTILDDAAHRDPTRRDRLASAGRVVPGVEVRRVDPATGRDVADGPAELWFRGEQQMGGYWNRPEEMDQTITADGWLRSGDVGIVDADGFVFLQDRVKDMAISGGENVYPAEVERALYAHPAVADAAVFGVPDDTWGETLRAAVVLHAGKAATADELIAFCRERLAHYKCPRAVDFLEALPRNATGKVLKRELRDPFWAGRERKI